MVGASGRKWKETAVVQTDRAPAGSDAWNDSSAEALAVRYVAQHRDEDRTQIVEQFGPLVERIARKFAGAEPLEDLVQVGYIGLLHALDRFDPQAGVKFPTYASYLVSGEIQHHLRDRSTTIRHPAWLQELRSKALKTETAIRSELGRDATTEEVATRLQVPEASVREAMDAARTVKPTIDPHSDEQEIDPIDLAEDISTETAFEDRMQLEQALGQLRDLEREVLIAFHFDSLNQVEIARRFDISANYVSHILRQSLAKLRRILTEEERRARLLCRQEAASSVVVVDDITGVYSEDQIRLRMDEELHRSSAMGQPCALVIVDFHGIGSLGKYYGRQAVEDLMADIADFMRECVRRLDVIGRFGKYGFAVVLPATGVHANVVRFRIQDGLQTWMKTRVAPGSQITAVVNHAVYPDDAPDKHDLWPAADPSQPGATTIAV